MAILFFWFLGLFPVHALPNVRTLYDSRFIPGVPEGYYSISAVDTETIETLAREYHDYLDRLVTIQDALVHLENTENLRPFEQQITLLEEIPISHGILSSRVQALVNELHETTLVDRLFLLSPSIPHWFFDSFQDVDEDTRDRYLGSYSEFLQSWWELGVALWEHDWQENPENPEYWDLQAFYGPLSTLHRQSEIFGLPVSGHELWTYTLPLRVFILLNHQRFRSFDSVLPGFASYLEKIDSTFGQAYSRSQMNDLLRTFALKSWSDRMGFSLLPEAWQVYWSESESQYNIITGRSPQRVGSQQDRDHWNRVSLLQHRLALQWVYQGRTVSEPVLQPSDEISDTIAQWFESFVNRTHDQLNLDAQGPDLSLIRSWFAFGSLRHPYPDVMDSQFIETLYSNFYEQDQVPRFSELSNVFSQWGILFPRQLVDDLSYTEEDRMGRPLILDDLNLPPDHPVTFLVFQYLPHMVFRPDPIDVMSHADRFLAALGFWVSMHPLDTGMVYTRRTARNFLLLRIFEYQRLGILSPMNTLNYISDMYGTDENLVWIIRELLGEFDVE